MTADAPTTEFDPDAADDAEPGGFLPVLTSVIRRRWTSSVFGIVAPGAVRRRPSDVARILTAIVLIAAISASVTSITAIEAKVFAVVAALPDGLTGVFEVLYRLGPIVAGGLAVSALVARRTRLLLTLLVAFAVGLGCRGAPLGAGRHHPGPEGRRNGPRRAQPGLPGRSPGRVHCRPPRRPALPHPPDPPHGRGRVLALRPRRGLPGRGPPRLGVGQHGPVVGSRRRRPLRLRLTRGDTRPPPGRRLPPRPRPTERRRSAWTPSSPGATPPS